MKTLLYIPAIISAAILFSFTQEKDNDAIVIKLTICGCAQISLDAFKEMKASSGDATTLKKIMNSYKEPLEACSKMMEAKEREAEDNEAKQNALMRELEKCEAYKELEYMMRKEMNSE